jgi:uncharacterized repeat protein (TIGR01451 family)
MTSRCLLGPALFLALLAVPIQVFGQCDCPPKQSPLLFVRFTGPTGMRAFFFQGRAPARRFNAPVSVGMRPGYCYRVRLTNLPGLPGLSLYPSIEVYGSLLVTAKLRAVDHPAQVTLTEDDIEAARRGNLITKIVYLENPDVAEPVASKPGEILEATMPRTTDLIAEAKSRGRLMLVVRIGAREPGADEILSAAVPGTILYPDERSMMPAQGPPCLPAPGFLWYDPYLGPRHPNEECFHDGGDRFTKAAIGREGALYGLDSEDSVAEYTDSHGRRNVVCSNRCCICAPRFLALRTEIPPAVTEGLLALESTTGSKAPDTVLAVTPPRQVKQTEILEGVTGRMRPSVNVALKTPAVLVGVKVLEAQELVIGPLELVGTKAAATLTAVQRALLVKQIEYALELSSKTRVSENVGVKGPVVVGRVTPGPEQVVGTFEVRDVTSCCCEKPVVPEKPLVLIKCADRTTGKPGDVVTFTITYSNHGGKPINDVAVSDSLSGRLEYIPDSAESDRDAVVTMQENEVGSVVLRWEIGGTLQPGQSGRLRFKARLR